MSPSRKRSESLYGKERFVYKDDKSSEIFFASSKNTHHPEFSDISGTFIKTPALNLKAN